MTSPAVDSFPNKRPRLASYDHKHYRPHPSPPSYTSPRSPPPQHQHQHQHHQQQQQQQQQHPQYQPHYPPPSQSYSYQQAPPPLPPPPPPPASAPPQFPPPPAPPHGAHHPAIPPPLPPAESGSRPPPSQHTLPMPLQHRPESGPDSYQYRPPPTHGYYQPQYAGEPMPAHTPTTPSQPPSAAEPPSRQYMPPYNGTHRSQSDAPLPSPYQQADLEMSQAHVQHASGTPLEQQRPPAYPAAAQQQQGPESPAYENGYTYGNSLPAAQSDAQQRRKAVRASQACESCRAKKCKCDEERPRCSNCITTDTQCNYRTLPPPKQERNMIQVIEQIASLGREISDMKEFCNSVCVRRDEFESLRAGLQATIREEMRGVHIHSKRGSDKSHSPGQHSTFASPAVLPGQTEPGSARPVGFKNVDGQYQHDQFTYSPANSHRSDPVNSLHSKGTPQQQSNRNVSRQKTDTKGIDDAAVKALDPLEGQLSIPVNHETGAHKLLIAWDAIHPLYNTVIDQEYAKNYVWREETRRGQLRLYGQGEGHDGSSRRKTVPPSLESPLCSESDSNSSGVSAADGFWGFSFDGPKARPADDCGGLDPDGSLCVDKDIIIRLFHSFMDNIWVMHPFLNQTELKFTFQKFVARYGRETMSPTSSFSAKSEFPPASKFEDNTKFKGPKRVRPDERGDEPAAPSKVPRSPGNNHTGPLERSISNAVILLILALGRICEHKDPIPPPVSGDTAQQDMLSPLDLGQATTNGMSRTASTDSQFIPPSKPVRHVRNIDKLPGLAYYAYAIGILGEQQGAPDLAHVHAKLLAGLYMGQMARVIDSWSWIHSACVSLQLIFKNEKELEDGPAERGDAIKFAFWTCLQLESDIIAELSELPHSGISRREDTMPLPRWSTVDYAPDAPETMIMIYYSAQINLRKILNRAHSALYSSGKESLKNPGWTILYAEDLAEQLQDWRRGLPPPFAWSDSDEPPSDINATRLRAKYYGAEYIIHRPFLHHLLQDEYGKASLDAGKVSTLKTKEKNGIIAMARHCIASAVKSTIAFDGLIGRPIVTNIFGTAHAQFGNILVLAACRTSRRYGWFVQPRLLNYLIERTIRFVGNIAPLAPTMRTNLEILRNVTNMVSLVPEDRFSGDEGGEWGVGEGARDGSLGGGGAGSGGNEGGEAGSDRMSIASGAGNGAGAAAAAAGAATVAGAAAGGSFNSNGGGQMS